MLNHRSTIYRDSEEGGNIQVGIRIVYDQDGEIVARLGEMEGNVEPRKELATLDYIDLEYAAIDPTIHRIVGVAPETKLPVLERTHAELLSEEHIKELETKFCC